MGVDSNHRNPRMSAIIKVLAKAGTKRKTFPSISFFPDLSASKKSMIGVVIRFFSF
jgi:hypothetical protein